MDNIMKTCGAIAFNILIVLVLFSGGGCSGNGAEQQAAATRKTASGAQGAKAALPGVNQDVLAIVNGSQITEPDVMTAARRIFGMDAVDKLDADAKSKVLKTLVASRAISQVAEKELSQDELARIDREAAAYREELLVNKYLMKHARPRPVSDAMIRHYYESHPEEFGAATIRTYEMITAVGKLTSGELDALALILKKRDKKRNWRAWASGLKKAGFPVSYHKGETSGGILDPRVSVMLSNLSPGRTSPVEIINGAPLVVRLLDEKQTAPQSLKDVYGRIKKMLAPARVKDAVREISRKALKNADVVYR